MNAPDPEHVVILDECRRKSHVLNLLIPASVESDGQEPQRRQRIEQRLDAVAVLVRRLVPQMDAHEIRRRLGQTWTEVVETERARERNFASSGRRSRQEIGDACTLREEKRARDTGAGTAIVVDGLRQEDG